ncbi:hypothetical protein LSH36_416g02046 [Paralvinella palmiformis]|uniref:BRICHOS domain-containing protein n=1 Tax=Paralvinella palmiformis TaxID=53620 RepID=A0AAD9JDC3_9ANNE|nr:hypothetical protein LSH36_416g02046 [Paralvinella palmiformis]
MEDKWPRGPLFQEKRSFKNAPCWIRILCIYAGTISGAFLAVTTLGVLHLQDLRQRCNPVGIERTQISEGSEDGFDSSTREEFGEDKFKRYTLRDQYLDVTELVDVNVRSGKAIFYFPATVETKSGVAIIDYYHHVAGLYISGSKERCYLAKDLDQYFPNVVNLQTFLESGKAQDSSKGSTNLDFEISNYGDPITDLDAIPKELHNACWGKTIYWLRQVGPREGETEDTEIIFAIITGTNTIFMGIRE